MMFFMYQINDGDYNFLEKNTIEDRDYTYHEEYIRIKIHNQLSYGGRRDVKIKHYDIHSFAR